MNVYINIKDILNSHFLIVLLMLLGYSQTSIAQNTINEKHSVEVLSIKDGLEKPFYPKFIVNYSFLSAIGKFREGQYYSAPYPSNDLEDGVPYNYEASIPPMGAGFSFEIGNIFWLKAPKPNRKLKFGILVIYHDFQFIFNKNDTGEKRNIVSEGIKVGPLFSYNPIGALLLDVRATAEFTLNHPHYDLFDPFQSTLMIKGGIGIDARYKRISLGLDFCFGNDGIKDDVVYKEHHFSTSIMRITFGLNIFPLEDE